MPVFEIVIPQTITVPGVPEPEETDFWVWRRGEPPTLVVVEPQLFDVLVSWVVEAQAVFWIEFRVAGTGLLT